MSEQLLLYSKLEIVLRFSVFQYLLIFSMISSFSSAGKRLGTSPEYRMLLISLNDVTLKMSYEKIFTIINLFGMENTNQKLDYCKFIRLNHTSTQRSSAIICVSYRNNTFWLTVKDVFLKTPFRFSLHSRKPSSLP